MSESRPLEQQKRKVLVADTSTTVRHLISGFLSAHCEVIEATSGGEVFSLVDETKDLGMIILSKEFADYDAFEITSELRKSHTKEELPIIFSTSTNQREVIIEALRSGVNDFIVKPFPKELLLSKITKLEKHIPLHDKELSKLIASIPFFNGVPESQVAYILHTLSETFVKEEGETVCAEGDSENDIFILLEGKCHVKVGGRKVGEIRPVDTIGEMGFMERKVRSATVVAVEKSKLVSIKSIPFESYLNEERSILEIILRNIIHSLNERIKKSNGMIQKLKMMAEDF